MQKLLLIISSLYLSAYGANSKALEAEIATDSRLTADNPVTYNCDHPNEDPGQPAEPHTTNSWTSSDGQTGHCAAGFACTSTSPQTTAYAACNGNNPVTYKCFKPGPENHMIVSSTGVKTYCSTSEQCVRKEPKTKPADLCMPGYYPSF